MPFTIEELRDLIKILEERPEWRAELRRLLLEEELLSLPQVMQKLAESQQRTQEQLEVLTSRINALTERMDALTRRVDALAEQMEALTRRVDALAEQMEALTQRVDALAEQMEALTRRVDALAEQVSGLSQQVSTLVEWQRGEAGRREGERYELNIVKRAPMLFAGGVGGATDAPRVQERLSKWLRVLLDGERFLQTDEDPTLSDLIWWKKEQVVVVEASLKVDGEDVTRAFKRASTLRSAGVNAIPVVVGEDWVSLEARELARERGVWWMIGGIPSEDFVAFRRLSPR